MAHIFANAKSNYFLHLRPKYSNCIRPQRGLLFHDVGLVKWSSCTRNHKAWDLLNGNYLRRDSTSYINIAESTSGGPVSLIRRRWSVRSLFFTSMLLNRGEGISPPHPLRILSHYGHQSLTSKRRRVFNGFTSEILPRHSNTWINDTEYLQTHKIHIAMCVSMGIVSFTTLSVSGMKVGKVVIIIQLRLQLYVSRWK